MSVPVSKYASDFSPQNIPGLVVWLDAADSNTITQSAGVVSLWKDKSPNALDVSQNTLASRPTYETNVQNGRSAIRFTTSQMMQSTQNFTLDKAQTWFVSFKALASGNIFFFEQGPNTNTSDGQFLYGANNSIMYMKRGAATRFIDDSIGRGTTPFALNTWYIAGLSTANTNGGAGDTYWSINGVPRATTLTSVIAGTATNALYINNTSRVPASNYYGEIIIYNQALSSNQVQLVERYLARKWGVTLSNTHPYFSVPAAMRPFNPLDVSGCTLWLDAADDSTMTFSGQNLTTWRDKSGVGNNGTATGTITRTGTINRTSVLRWTSATGNNYVSGAISNTTTALSAFAVANVATSSANWSRIFSLSVGSGADYVSTPNVAAMFKTPSGGGYGSYRGNAYAAVNATPIFDTPIIVSTIFTGASNIFYVNGAGGTPFASSGSFGYSNYAVGQDIGASAASLIGSVAEVLHWPRFLTTTERQQVELYLAEKWGLRSSLSSSNAMRLYRSLSPVFNPSLLSNCTLWLDAADYTRFTFGTGSSVSTWSDKSGVGRSLVSQTATGAIASNFNGYPSLYFGRAPWYRTTNFVLSNTQGTSWFTVYATTGNITTSGAVLATVTGPERSIRQDSTVQFSGYSIHTGVVRAYNDAGASNTPAIYNMVDTPSAFTVFKNGAQLYNTNTSVTYQSGSNQTLQIGYWNDFFLGHIFEICIFDRTLTTAERQLVEGYLANKWNLSLPSNHPYKTIRV